MSKTQRYSDIRDTDLDDDRFEFCRENPDALREVEQFARETGRDAFADACLDVLEQIGAAEGDQS